VQISISTRHGHVSTATKEKISEKVKKLTRFFERLTAADVTIDLERSEEPSVEIRVSAEHADDFIAVADSGGFWASIDSAVHKLEQQLRKHKEKFKTRRSSARKHQDDLAEPASGAD